MDVQNEAVKTNNARKMYLERMDQKNVVGTGRILEMKARPGCKIITLETVLDMGIRNWKYIVESLNRKSTRGREI